MVYNRQCGSCREGSDRGAMPFNQCAIKYPSLAMLYPPCQRFSEDTLYPPEKALCSGTLFTELNLPFTGICGGSSCSNGRYQECRR